MATTNSVRSVCYVKRGERTIQHVGDEVGFGFAIVPVAEAGYYVELADCHVFVPESSLRAARETARTRKPKPKPKRNQPPLEGK